MISAPPGVQKGVALLLATLVLLIATTAAFLYSWNSARGRAAYDLATETALREAKEALIAYAVSVNLSGSGRLGDLPCPDLDNDGKKETSCGNASGTTGQAARLGRLPWKDLGIADLRDGSGERLWYAVSSNFKENFRSEPLNSDTTGTIRVVDATGKVLSNVVAIVIAPGEPLQRQGSATVQERSGTNQNDPTQYLDVANGEDNADFADGSSTNGFIAGPVRDAAGRVIANDRILAITYEDIMPIIEKRVASEVLNCLSNYAAYNVAPENNAGHFPWAASLSTSAAGSYDDTAGVRFGRFPDRMCATGGEGAGDILCDPVVGTNPAMLQSWGAVSGCSVTNSWFTHHWREQVFYAIADGYKPGTSSPSCGTCLTVETKTSLRAVVIVARKALPGQDRTSGKANAANYLESQNATPYDDIFTKGGNVLVFNDLVLYR